MQWEQAQREASRGQKQWQRQKQQQQQQQGRTYKQYNQQQQQEQQQRKSKYKQAKKDDFIWDFDVNDPWSILGVLRSSSKDEVSKAFRKVSIMLVIDTSGMPLLLSLHFILDLLYSFIL